MRAHMERRAQRQGRKIPEKQIPNTIHVTKRDFRSILQKTRTMEHELRGELQKEKYKKM